MQYQPILDTALGLCFLYFAAALFCSGFVEWLSNLLKKRAKALLVGLSSMLVPGQVVPDPAPGEGLRTPPLFTATAKKESFLYQRALTATSPAATQPSAAGFEITTQMLIGHPLITPFRKSNANGDGSRNPSYIPSDVLARALFDTIRTTTSANFTIDDQGHAVASAAGTDPIVTMLGSLSNSLGGPLSALYRVSEGNVTEFIGRIEKWYDAQMDRVIGTYRRWAKRWGIVVAVVVVMFLHLDSVAIAQDLWTDESVRAAVVASAVDTSCTPDEASAGTQADCVKTQIDKLASDGLPIGPQEWLTLPGNFPEWLMMLAGLAVSVAAISMGAPFWFGLMNKFVNVRNAGDPPQSSGK